MERQQEPEWVSLLPPAPCLKIPQSWTSQHSSVDTKNLYRLSLPRYIYSVGISQVQAARRAGVDQEIKQLPQPIHSRGNLTCLWFRKKTVAHNQSPWFPWSFHHPALLMKTSISHLSHAPKAAHHTGSCLQKYTLRIPISSFSFPPILQKWTGPRNRHPFNPKAWRKTSLRHKTMATRSSSFHWMLC